MPKSSNTPFVNIDFDKVTKQDFAFARKFIKKAILVSAKDIVRVEKVLNDVRLNSI